MTETQMRARDPLIGEAAELWLAVNAAPDDAALHARIQGWRAQSPAHERAFAAAETVWQLAGARAHVPALPHIAARRVRRGTGVRARRITMGLAGAAAACLAVAVLPSLPIWFEADYRTATGERRSVALADGSSVTLDSGSAIALDDRDGRRGVKLLAGRAWFDVAKDPARPFIVSAGDAQVTVTGTAFDVDLESDLIDVTLAEGSVRAGWTGTTPARMTPGDRLHLDRASHGITRDRGAPSSMGSWRRDRLLLENVSLGDGIAQLRRYHRGAILIASPSLARQRVTGVFDVRTPAEALRLMVRQHGATVREITPWLLIVS